MRWLWSSKFRFYLTVIGVMTLMSLLVGLGIHQKTLHPDIAMADEPFKGPSWQYPCENREQFLDFARRVMERGKNLSLVGEVGKQGYTSYEHSNAALAWLKLYEVCSAQ